MRHLTRRAGRGAKGFLVALLIAIVLGTALGMLWGRLPHAREVADKPGASKPRATTDKPVPEGPEKLVLSETQLTEMLRQAAGTSAQDAKVLLQPGQIVVQGTVKHAGLAVPTRAILEPYAEGGSISVVVREAKAAGVPLPRGAVAALADRVKHMLGEQQQKIKGLVVDTVEVKDKELVLTGHFERS